MARQRPRRRLLAERATKSTDGKTSEQLRTARQRSSTPLKHSNLGGCGHGDGKTCCGHTRPLNLKRLCEPESARSEQSARERDCLFEALLKPPIQYTRPSITWRNPIADRGSGYPTSRCSLQGSKVQTAL